MAQRRLPIAVLVLAVSMAAACGCTKSFSAKQISAPKIYRQQTATALDSSELSASTQQTLRLMSLDEAYRKQPQAVTQQLYDQVYKTADPELMTAAAEMALLEARRLESKDAAAAGAMNMAAASLAYDYLFLHRQLERSDALKPSYRFMADVFNMAVSKLVENRGLKDDPWTDQPGIGVLATTWDLTVHKNGRMLWDPDAFDTIKAANEIKIGGFKNMYFSRGLGAPMVGYIDHPRAKCELGRYLPIKGAAFPVTAVLSFGPPVETHCGRRRTVELAFYNPVFTDHAFLNGMDVPLEADYTTPLAVLMSQIQAPDQGFKAMMKSDRYIPLTGMRMLQPYQAGKIPVVMVHGLMSTPETWVDMFNDLMGDPELRYNYQFWFFAYPTGLPIIYSASLLRNSLLQIQADFDTGPDTGFRHMVLVGHSMGGLLARLMIQNSGSRYWDSLFSKDIDQIQMSPADKEFLANILFFDSLPFVQRVIFIATPHRGSKLADRPLARFGAGFISLPGEVQDVGELIMQTPAGELAFDPKDFRRRVPNSIDLLSPSSRFLQTMQTVPFAPGVPYHSIIGIRNATVGPGSSDGVVAYASSHLEGAVSKKLVPSDHAVQKNAQAIAEVKRILKYHLSQIRQHPVGGQRFDVPSSPP